jgi:hypothetical protein
MTSNRPLAHSLGGADHALAIEAAATMHPVASLNPNEPNLYFMLPVHRLPRNGIKPGWWVQGEQIGNQAPIIGRNTTIVVSRHGPLAVQPSWGNAL